jgi:adenosine kinase
MMAKACGISEEKLASSAPLTIITRGEKGSLIIDGATKKQHEIPVAPVTDVVDPTGAGDAFISGIAWGLKRGLAYEISGRVGALAAAFAIEKKGCQEHAYSRDAFAARYQQAFGAALSW